MFIRCKDHVIAKVLVDNGSSLNVLIKVMLNHLLVDTSYIWMSKIMACLIDGSSMQIIGDIIIELEIDPNNFSYFASDWHPTILQFAFG